MCRRKSRCDLLRNPDDLFRRQRPLSIETSLQRFAAQIGHDKKRQRAIIRHAMNHNHVRMQHCGRRFGFASKPSPGGSAGGQSRRENLNCDGPIQRPVKGFQHDTHAARTNDTRDFIAAKSPEHLWIVGGIQHAQDLSHLCRRCSLAVMHVVAIMTEV